MTTTRFQLVRTESERDRLLRRATRTWSGTLPGIGAVELTCPKEAWYSSSDQTVRVSGGAVPSMVFRGIGFRGLPRMARVKLTADAHQGRLHRRHLAVTRRGRALHVDLAGRSYRYRVLDSKLRHELSRKGVVVTMTRSRWRRPETLSGVAQGGADGLDLALAILLEGVYTRNLSFGGAVYSWPGRFLSREDLVIDVLLAPFS
ncbi:hypothetical protein AB0A94_05625 [Streptomyces sp. NPDC044984]|uniref:hypothetical protein n=1 Tax=Streptomyces sp. NPDC044984 TaxID=3154335 RepID=UPI0033C33860